MLNTLKVKAEPRVWRAKLNTRIGGVFVKLADFTNMSNTFLIWAETKVFEQQCLACILIESLSSWQTSLIYTLSIGVEPEVIAQLYSAYMSICVAVVLKDLSNLFVSALYEVSGHAS